MTFSENNPFDERHEMSDAQLDELLGNATPKLGREQKSRLRQNLMQAIKVNRSRDLASSDGWLFRLSSPRAMGIVAATCVLLIVVGSFWYANNFDQGKGPNEIAETQPPKSPTQTPSIASSAVAPVIVTRYANERAAHSRETHSEASKSRTFSSFVTNTKNRWMERLESSCLEIGNSELGLTVVGDVSQWLDQHAHESVATVNKRRSRLRNRPAASDLELVFAVRQSLESRLIQKLKQPNKAPAAFRLLCRLGTKKSLPTIFKAWSQPELRSDIVIAANRLADSETLGKLALSTDDPNLQVKIMSHLLCRHDAASLDIFLELTARYELYSIAQQSGQLAHCLPTNALVNRLQSKRIAIARAAAITLSNMDDPQISQQLIQLAQRPATSQVAMMALTARNDASSQNFLRLVANDLRWSATVNTARKKWNRLLAVN